jgi:hypothetical protein
MVSQTDDHCPLDAGPGGRIEVSSVRSMVTGMFMPLAPTVAAAPLMISVQIPLCYDLCIASRSPERERPPFRISSEVP